MEQIEESVFSEVPVVYANFGTRLVAALIDALIIIVPYRIGQHFLGHSILLMAAVWLYFALQESGRYQATIGKKAMRIKVVGLGGRRITFGQATGRYFGKFISVIILFIGYFQMLWHPQRQTLHDQMAGTFVIKDNPVVF